MALNPISIDKIFEVHKELLTGALERQFEYGKWVLASLLAVHLGALFVISQAGEARAELFAASGRTLIAGIVAALVAGGMAWINFTAASVSYQGSMQALIDQTRYLPSWKLQAAIRGPMWIAVGCAITSLICFVLAAIFGLNALPTPTTLDRLLNLLRI